MNIYGNHRAMERLSEYGKSNRLPHSLLFFGDSGTGKRTLADYTAMQYLCKAGKAAPCMSCTNCDRIENHIHPDVIYADCSDLSAEGMRNMLRSTYEMPVEGDIRVYILSEFQLLNRECQNALLTYLEEPSDRIRFILTASNRNGILPTILSRTALIQTEALSAEECEAALKEKGCDNAARLAQSFNGNLGMALRAMSDKNAEAYKSFSKELAEYICERKEYKALELMQRLPQPKEDKREPVRAVITEEAKILHNAFVIAGGGRMSKTAHHEISERLAKTCTADELNALCIEAEKFGRIVTDTNFNSKITANAFISAVFAAIESNK